MMGSDRPQQQNQVSWRKRLSSPRAALAAVVVISVGTAFAPPALVAPLRHGWETLLRPAQAGVGRIVEFGRGRIAWCRGALASADRLAVAEDETARLTEEEHRLKAELELVRGTQSASAGEPAMEPLLRADVVPARVLGRQAQSYLKSRELLDAGGKSGVMAGALVLDGDVGKNGKTTDAKKVLAHRPTIDAGADLGVPSDALVLAGRRVWGKIAAVGQFTSVVRRMSEPGYRDAVQIGHVDGRRLQLGPRGLLVGTGDTLCRIEMVEASQPVAIGDEVYTDDDGVPHAPLLYGRIVRLERAAGEPHWQIWMEPAIGSEEPRNVAVLRMELNPARMAKAGSR